MTAPESSRRFVTTADDNESLYAYCWEALRFNPINPFVVRHCAKDYTIASGTLLPMA